MARGRGRNGVEGVFEMGHWQRWMPWRFSRVYVCLVYSPGTVVCSIRTPERCFQLGKQGQSKLIDFTLNLLLYSRSVEGFKD